MIISSLSSVLLAPSAQLQAEDIFSRQKKICFCRGSFPHFHFDNMSQEKQLQDRNLTHQDSPGREAVSYVLESLEPSRWDLKPAKYSQSFV